MPLNFSRARQAPEGRAVADALQEWGDAVLTESNRRVPYLTGELMRSGEVVVDGTEGAVTYRDSKAVAAHEDMKHKFRNGRRSKFLESALHDSRRDGQRILGDALRRELQ